MFYDEFEANINWVEKPWAHNWATDVPEEWGLPYGMTKKESCTESGGRLIYNCGFDTAGEILTHLLPNIDGSTVQPKDLDWMSKGQMMKFDQTEFVEFWDFGYTGLAEDGYVYYPD